MTAEGRNFIRRQGTRWEVLSSLKRVRKATLEQLTEELRQNKQIELSSATVRSHLVALMHEGWVTADEVRGKVGRPHHIYYLTLDGESLFPKNYHLLASTMLDYLQDSLSEEYLYKIFDHMSDRLSAQYAFYLRPGQSLEERIQSLVEAMNERNQLVEYAQDEQGWLLRRYNCPYIRVAQQHPQICRLDCLIFRKLLNASVEHLDCQLDGAPACTYRITKFPEPEPIDLENEPVIPS